MWKKVGASMVLPKRLFRLRKASNQTNVIRNRLETAVREEDGGIVSCIKEDGVMRMKIVVRKQDLKQMLEVIRGNDKIQANQPSSSLSCSAEQRLNLLRKKYLLRANKEGRCSGSWSPALQSIPEEV